MTNIQQLENNTQILEISPKSNVLAVRIAKTFLFLSINGKVLKTHWSVVHSRIDVYKYGTFFIWITKRVSYLYKYHSFSILVSTWFCFFLNLFTWTICFLPKKTLKLQKSPWFNGNFVCRWLMKNNGMKATFQRKPFR